MGVEKKKVFKNSLFFSGVMGSNAKGVWNGVCLLFFLFFFVFLLQKKQGSGRGWGSSRTKKKRGGRG